MLNVTFFGVRVSEQGASDPPASRYGGHGPCVALEVPEGDAILLDVGTGAAQWAATVDAPGPRPAHALLTRAHADHLAGLPLVHARGGRPDVLGPPPGQLSGGARWVVVDGEDLAVGDAKVAVRPVPHPERVNGYRVEWEGVAVAYVGVHQAPPALDTVAPQVLELAAGADLLVHDASLTAEDWASDASSGHSTADYALLVAGQAGARRVALYGHRRERDDDQLDRILTDACRTAARLGVEEVLVAAEGTTVSFERPRP